MEQKSKNLLRIPYLDVFEDRIIIIEFKREEKSNGKDNREKSN